MQLSAMTRRVFLGRASMLGTGFAIGSAAGFVLASDPAHAAAGPQVRIEFDYGRVGYDMSRNGQQLGLLFGKYGGRAKGLSFHTRGLTLYAFGADWEMVTDVTHQGSRSMVAPRALIGRVGFGDMTVMVDSKYRPGSCEHTNVLEHEHNHVEINRTSLKFYGPYILEKAQAVAATIQPIRVGGRMEPRQAIEAMLDDFTGKVTPVLDFATQERNKFHKKLDSEVSYAWTEAQCRNW